ncbi:MAG TPA: SIMPL domain-containing protein, partial [Ignavibacteriaceae bacterium]
NVQTDALTANEASDKNAEIVSDLKENIVALGFNESEIKTQNFNVYPQYDYSGGNQRITRYTATHSLKIEILIGDKDKIGSVIDAGVGAGAGIGYINFELNKENENKYKAEAITLATEDAKIKAEALAYGAGKKLGRLVSVSTSDFGYQPWRVFSSDSGLEVAEAKEAVSTDINPSDQTVSASVTAVFKIR